MLTTTGAKYDVFVSYCHRNTLPATIIAESLRDSGLDVFLDVWEIRLGDPLVTKVEEALESSRAGMVLFSSASTNSKWVRSEYMRMMARLHADDTFRLMPVRLDATELPGFASDRLWRDFFNHTITDARVLAAEVHAILKGPSSRSKLGRITIWCRQCYRDIPSDSEYCCYCGCWLKPLCPKCHQQGECTHSDSGGPSMYFENFEFKCLNPKCGHTLSSSYKVGDAVEGYQPLQPKDCPYCGRP